MAGKSRRGRKSKTKPQNQSKNTPAAPEDVRSTEENAAQANDALATEPAPDKPPEQAPALETPPREEPVTSLENETVEADTPTAAADPPPREGNGANAGPDATDREALDALYNELADERAARKKLEDRLHETEAELKRLQRASTENALEFAALQTGNGEQDNAEVFASMETWFAEARLVAEAEVGAATPSALSQIADLSAQHDLDTAMVRERRALTDAEARADYYANEVKKLSVELAAARTEQMRTETRLHELEAKVHSITEPPADEPVAERTAAIEQPTVTQHEVGAVLETPPMETPLPESLDTPAPEPLDAPPPDPPEVPHGAEEISNEAIEDALLDALQDESPPATVRVDMSYEEDMAESDTLLGAVPDFGSDDMNAVENENAIETPVDHDVPVQQELGTDDTTFEHEALEASPPEVAETDTPAKPEERKGDKGKPDEGKDAMIDALMEFMGPR